MIPDPLASLRASTLLAVDELAAFRSTDPAAAHAVQAAKLAAHTLHSFWLPTIDEARARRPGRRGDPPRRPPAA